MCNQHCNLILDNRSELRVSGVIEILSFEDELIVLYTSCGDLRIKGNNLNVINAFEKEDVVFINGIIDSLSFSNNNEKMIDNIISRLFR